jgi:hypothetical protein
MPVRYAPAVAVSALVAAYVVWIVRVGPTPDHRLASTELVLLFACATLLIVTFNPSLLQTIESFKLGAFEVRLERLRQAQAAQDERLDDLAFVLTSVLTEQELNHLYHLGEKRKEKYKGHSYVRAELRRLRYLGLIATIPGSHIAKIPGQGKEFDLAQYVSLTPRGQSYLNRLRELNRDRQDDGPGRT